MKMKRNDKTKRNERQKNAHNMTRQHVTKVTYNFDSIRFDFFFGRCHREIRMYFYTSRNDMAFGCPFQAYNLFTFAN